MIQLFNGHTGELIGHVTETQFDELMDCLADDTGQQRFVIDRDLLGYLAEHNVDEPVLELLTGALGDTRELLLEYHILDEVDIEFGPEEEEEEEEE